MSLRQNVSIGDIERIIPALTRAGVTLILAGVFSAGFLNGLIPGGNFTTVVGMVMAFWFGSRVSGNRRSDEPSTTLPAVDEDPSRSAGSRPPVA